MHKRIYGIERETAFFPDDATPLSRNGIWGLVERFLPRKQNCIIVMPQNLQMLPNGSRLYLDSGDHIEIATPECDRARDAVIWDKACERILERIALSMNQPSLFFKADKEIFEQRGGVTFLKTSTGIRVRPQELRDQKHRSRRTYISFGTHLSLCASKQQTSHTEAMAILAPFLLTSYWFSGAGLLWVDHDGEMSFSLSQRVPFLTRLNSSATVSHHADDWGGEQKPLFIFRHDEMHADSERYFRVHICGADSCMNEWPTYLLLWGVRPHFADARRRVCAKC